MAVGKKPKKVVNPEDFLPLGENDRHIRVIFHGRIASRGPEEIDATFQQLMTSNLVIEANILGESAERFLLSDAISNNDSPALARGGNKSGSGSGRGEGGHGGSSRKDIASSMKALVGDSGCFSCLLSQKRVTVTLSLLRRLCGGFSESYVSFYQQLGLLEDNRMPEDGTSTEALATHSSYPLPSGGGKNIHAGEKALTSLPSTSSGGNTFSQKIVSARDRSKRSSAVVGGGWCLEKVQLHFEDVLRSSTKRYDLHLEKYESVRRFLSTSWIELECRDLPLLPDALLRRYYPVRIALHSLDFFEDFLSDEEGEDSSEKEGIRTSSQSGKWNTSYERNRSGAHHLLQRQLPSAKSVSEQCIEHASDCSSSDGSRYASNIKGNGLKAELPSEEGLSRRNCLNVVINCLGHTITTPSLPALRRRRGTHSLQENPSSVFLSKKVKKGGEPLSNNELELTPPEPSSSGTGGRQENDGHLLPSRGWFPSGETKEIFHSIIFLGHSTPLRVYQRALSEDVTVSVHRHDQQHRHLLKPPDKEKGDPLLSKFFHLGTGSFSLRSLVEHQQTLFHETIQLLPNRTSLVNSESTLTSGSNISMTIEFFQPLPPVEHVNESGAPVSGVAMTRGVLILPYAGEYVEGAMSAFLRELLRCKRGGQEADVRAYETPPTVEVDEEDSIAKKGKRIVKERSVSVRDAKKDVGRKGRQKSKVPTPPLPPPAPPEVAAFDAPFQVVSPEGISGFEVMDEEMRLICLEGPAPEVHHILKTTAAACDYPEDGSLKILYNAELFTPSRLYAQFPPLITRIPRGTVANPTENAINPSSAYLDFLHDETSTTSSSPSVGVVVHPDVEPSLQLLQDAEAAVEAEAGGTAGRLHRIRLREPLRVLGREQKFLLHRLLSESCLTCIQKLFALSHVNTLWKAVQRYYFPSAVDLIHLERSFGQTLDLQDVLARASYANHSNLLTTDEGNTARIPRRIKKEISRMHEVDVTHLCEDDVGLLTSFRGRLLAKAKHVPAEVLRRYSISLWMVTNTGAPVLCAFPREVPGGTIQYMLEGQVVKVERNTFLLYIMEFHTISNNITTSKNPAYEDFLLQRRQCEKRLALLKREVARSSHHREHSVPSSSQLRESMPSATGETYADSDIGSFIGLKPSSFPFHRPKEENRRESWVKDPEEDSEEASEEDILGNLPPDDVVSSIGSAEAAFAEYWEHRCGPPLTTKSTALLLSRNRKPKPTAEHYMRLWQRYDQRAMKVLPEVPRGPVMRFGKV